MTHRVFHKAHHTGHSNALTVKCKLLECDKVCVFWGAGVGRKAWQQSRSRCAASSSSCGRRSQALTD